MSSTSRTYAIRDADEARAYLREALLCSRLVTITTAVAEHLSQGTSLERLMGSSLDAQKLVSSMTLFAEVARGLHAAEDLETCRAFAEVADRVLEAATRQGYARCRFTMEQLAR